MTHDELLAKLEHDGLEHWDYSIPTSHRAVEALRAVVELHKPVQDEWIDYVTCYACRVGMDDHYSPEYPCLTILTIEKELS